MDDNMTEYEGNNGRVSFEGDRPMCIKAYLFGASNAVCAAKGIEGICDRDCIVYRTPATDNLKVEVAESGE